MLPDAAGRPSPHVPRIIQGRLEKLIRELHEFQVAVYEYNGAPSQKILAEKLIGIQNHVRDISSSKASASLGSVPPEIISYIEDGRNPDIYTREFVELVQKGNMFLKGKCEAFGEFKNVLAAELVAGGIASQDDVDSILSTPIVEPTDTQGPDNGATNLPTE